MKKTIQLLVVFTLSVTATTQAQFWNNKSLKGNGNIISTSRTINEYDAISCAGPMDFILIKGNEGLIKIEGEENLLEYIITEVKGNKLIVRVEHGVNLKPSWNKSIEITIPFEDINAVSLSGSGDVWNTDVIYENELKVTLSGSGDIKLNVKTKYLESALAGSGDITISGNTESLETTVTGSGGFHGFDLQSELTKATVTGSGNLDVVSNHTLTARVTGSGNINYKGQPEKEDTKVTGSGSIRN